MGWALSSATFVAATLFCHASALSFGGGHAIHYREMAELGLLPDGTPMEPLDLQVSKLTQLGKNLAAEDAPAAEVITSEYVKVPLDHFGQNKQTFFNQYWVAESGYKKGGPVFIYDFGEANASTNAIARLQNPASFFKQIVDQYGGIGIVWEHRFYGNSTPVPIDNDTPAEDFKYLTTEQSLADVKTFADQFSRKNFPDVDLTPKGTPWVFVGGSYPGMRAAFMRKFYPDTIYASYASSAPVEARVDMSVYFEPVVRGLKAYGFGNCTADVNAAITYMDKLMDDPKKAATLKNKVLGRNAANNSNGAFATALNVIFYLWQSYGVEGGETGLRYFCDWIETDPSTNKTAPAEGWAKSKGPQFVVDRWASWPQFAPLVNDYLYSDCEGPGVTNGTAPKCFLDEKTQDPAGISWTWQYCTQWGFFQSANLGPNQVVSKYNSLQHQRDICHRQFPDASRALLPEWPNTDRTNKVFGGWDIRPSNVYWSGGEFDPWRTLSPLSGEPWAPHPQLIQQAPACGVSTAKSVIFGYTMANAQHCYDFRTTFANGTVSRGYFTSALTQWLKCWKPKGGYS